MKVTIPKGAKAKVKSSEDIYTIMHAILMRQNKLRRKKEYFWTIGLNTSSDIMYIELISMGGLNETTVEPIEVFSLAVGKKCNRLILVHNHPSTNTKPSTQDLRLTKRLGYGAGILNITILDHLIITEENGYYSFADEGDL